LQELAKKNTAGGGAAGAGDMASMMKEAMANPDYLAQLGEMGDQFGEALEQMMKLSPEEMQQQMEQAMKMMTDGDVVENILNNKDEVLASLEASGSVPPEELARYKKDPVYFELKMRESFEQMGTLFSDPKYLEQTAEVMKMMSDPSHMEDIMKKAQSEMMQSDEEIEQTRLDILQGKGELGGMKEMFETPEMQEILKDPVKWKETVKEGMAGMMGGGFGGGGGDVKDEL